MLRPCIEPGPHWPTELTRQTRCQLHARQYERSRVGRRGDRYNTEHRRLALEAINEEPWCHWPGCGRRDDLTADHTPDGYQVLCRSHNSEKANRARAAARS